MMRPFRFPPFLALAAVLLAACGEEEPAGPAADPLLWSLDIDLAGDAAFTGLVRDTSLTAAVRGDITGRVIGLDTAKVKDTLFFRNVENPDFAVAAPLAADGAFAFEAYDIVGDLDGSQTLLIFLKFKHVRHRPVPDTLRILLDRL